MYTVTKQFRFEAAHRIVGHEGKCCNLHGHSYLAEITVGVKDLNEMDMVLDFAYIKNTVGKWIDDNWDHQIILSIHDPIQEWFPATEKVPWLMVGKPTAENLAKTLFVKACQLLASWYNVEVLSVTIHETATSKATWTPD